MPRVPQVSLQSRLLLRIERDALVVVIGQRLHHDAGLLRDRQQTRFLTGNRNAFHGVQMQDAMGVVTYFVDRAVNRITRRIDLVRTVECLPAGKVDPNEARCSDLIEHQAVGIDQEIMRSRHARRDMRENQVIPAEQRHQPIGGREIDTHCPFFRGYSVLHAGNGTVDDAHDGPCYAIEPPKG